MSESLRADLTSISGIVDSLRQRISDLTLTTSVRLNTELLSALYEAERSLTSADRHLTRATRSI